MLQPASLVVLITVTALAAWVVLRLRSVKSAIDNISGPQPPSWILGNQAELMQSEAGVANYIWRKAFGNVYRFQGCFGAEWLMVNDPKAIAHVLQGQVSIYHWEESIREFLRLVTGPGVIWADGSDHTRQRRLLQPSFRLPFVQGLTQQFAECGDRVAKQWQRLVDESENTMVQVNAYDWAEKVTMEAIGQTVFGVRFGIIEGEHHELAHAYQGIVSTAFSRPTKLFIALQALAFQLPSWIIAFTDYMPTKRMRALRAARASSLAFARRLIREKRQRQMSSGGDDRDLLSILTKAGEEEEKGKFTPMTEEEIHAQLTTFFFAGYETSCNTLTFALYEIARDRSIQDRVYAEITDVLGPHPEPNAFTYSALEDMTYLQAVVKETLRIHAAISYGILKAGKDNVIPLSKPITSTEGDMIYAVHVPKGQRVFISYDGVNRSEDVWGPDANEFKPDRWLKPEGHLDDFATEARCGGPYANLATFGGGPKACLGWRVAVIELHTFLAVLVGKFRFQVASGFRLQKDGCNVIVTPMAQGQSGGGPWMPLQVENREAQAVDKYVL